MSVEIWSPRAVESLRRAGRAAAATLAFVGRRLRAGVSTAEIDAWVREDTGRRGGRPSQLGYHGFPAAVCTSRNHVVCHGIPRRDEVLAPGDIVNVDVTTELDGFHGDTSATFVIGTPSPEARRKERRASSAPTSEGARWRRPSRSAAEPAVSSSATAASPSAIRGDLGESGVAGSDGVLSVIDGLR